MMHRDKVYASRQLAGRVLRYHTWPVLHRQTTGEHSARVANIVVEVFGMPRAAVLYYALNHDAGELWAGDVPFGVKCSSDELKRGCAHAEQRGLQLLELKLPELSALEQTQVKIADLLEMWEFSLAEWLMGNQFSTPIMHDTRAKAQELAAQNELSEHVNKWLRTNALLGEER